MDATFFIVLDQQRRPPYDREFCAFLINSIKNKIFNVKITNNGSCVGTIRFALNRKISFKTEKQVYFNRGRVRVFSKNHGKRLKKYGTTLTASRGKQYGPLRYGTELWINSEPLLYRF